MVDQHVLVLSPLRTSSGNFTTANRISNYLTQDGLVSWLRDPADFKTVQDFTNFIHKNQVDIVIGLHALHTSAYLKACRVPYILVFGGTDLNLYGRHPRHYATMTPLVDHALYLVAFSQEMINSVLELWPTMKKCDRKLKLIPQGVITQCSNYDFRSQIQGHLRSCDLDPRADLTHDLVTFTLVAGIRPVKDPLYLVDTFSDWHECCRPDAYLIIIGPVIDEEYGVQFMEYIKNRPGVVYLGGLDQTDMHTAIHDSTALVNSSVSEGNSMAILEAMSVGTPVIARDIPGNCGLIVNNVSGLLYNTPQDFILKAEALIHTDGLRYSLVKAATSYVRDHHSCDLEGQAYRRMVTEGGRGTGESKY